MKPEDNYPKYMKEKILPYILLRREETYLTRNPGQTIYCAFYTAGRSTSSQGQDENALKDKSARNEAQIIKGIILISHGFTETADKYFEVIYEFLKAGYHVCIPEHCGHGRSYRLVEDDLSLVYTDSWQRYVDDLKFVALSARSHWSKDLPLFLFAHSMGGGVGAALAAKEPHLFQKVILSSPMIRPATGNVPWPLTKLIVSIMCAFGKEKSYVIGQHAYDGKETFKISFATSQARWAWYKEKTDKEPLFQTAGASYGWLREAIRLNQFLINDAWRQIAAPVLLIQATEETVVSKEQQEKFITKLAKVRKQSESSSKGAGSSDAGQPADREVRFVRISGAKHEIFRSDDETFAKYLGGCLEFLA
ncbi:MAG: alpha/beta hydrolase [Lachnospiraceae bacterium]|nr:alpha/beta hydrolase [Lachnospiraceae bacterium]